MFIIKKTVILFVVFTTLSFKVNAASFEIFFEKLMKIEGIGLGINKAVWGNQSMNRNEAYHFYKKNFWLKYHGDLFKNQAVADVLIDHLVNGGEGKNFINIKAFEAVIGVKQDGFLSIADVNAANKIKNIEAIVNPYVNYRIYFYQSRKNISKYPGWISRAKSFYKYQKNGNLFADYVILPKILLPKEPEELALSDFE